MAGTCNGFRNWETWNVWVWITNDAFLYNNCVNYIQTHLDPTYTGFISSMGLQGQCTPDGAPYDGDMIDVIRLDTLVAELLD